MLQLRIHQFGAHLRLLHLEISPEDFGMMSGHLNGHDDAAESAPRHPINKTNKHTAEWAALVDGCTGNTCHESSSRIVIHCCSERFISSSSFCRSWARCS